MGAPFEKPFDLIVVGAGHAGCEAALCGARLGWRVIVFCLSTDHVAFMPCNPHIGGSSKGHLVREIDALGGEMGQAIDHTFLQSRMLNLSKGPAVHSLRAQADKQAYSAYMRRALEKEENIFLKQAEVTKILTDEENRVTGAETATGLRVSARALILCAGTYLSSRCLTGETITASGPNGLQMSGALSKNLEKMGIRLRRFKTGTPARMDGKSLDYSKMQIQEGDVPVRPFSFDTDPKAVQKEQVPCYLTYTNKITRDIIKENIHRSPIYAGVIEGIGPRYCPSIEDKVVRFADKERHQVFVEPEGAHTDEVYIDGMSSSMPEDVQWKMYRSVPGLENCRIVKAAYAIEYDCLESGQLTPRLEIRGFSGLYCAGQLNGSSGYEEAAAQGLFAALQAAAFLKGEEGVRIDRSEGYIGVLVDDLVHKELTEPYRMMTSRAEYRLLLRQDNADTRLREKGFRAGLVSREKIERLRKKEEVIASEIRRMKETVISPSGELNAILEEAGTTPVTGQTTLAALLTRPQVTLQTLHAIDSARPSYASDAYPAHVADEIAEQIEICIKYEGYLLRQERQVVQFRKQEERVLPKNIDYQSIRGLRLEAAEKLSRLQPETVGAASRIAGVNPADIAVLLVYLERRA